MKLLPFLACAALAVGSAVSVSAASFEGIVRIKMTQPKGDSHEMTYRVKEGFVRTEFETKEGVIATIIDVNKQEMMILMPEQKMYMTQSFAAVAEKASKSSDVTLEKTSETEKILGYDCVKYVSKSKDQVSDIWVTDELGRFVGFGRGAGAGRRGAAGPAAWETLLMNKDFFPLRVVSRNAKGKEQLRMEAVSVEKQAQADALFAPPPGFQRFDMGGLMRGLIPGAAK